MRGHPVIFFGDHPLTVLTKNLKMPKRFDPRGAPEINMVRSTYGDGLVVLNSFSVQNKEIESFEFDKVFLAA